MKYVKGLCVGAIWLGCVLGGLLCPLTIQAQDETPFVVVLGVAQDGGYPQAGCVKACCRGRSAENQEGPVCLGLVDPTTGQRWMFECTPRFPAQLALFNQLSPVSKSPGLEAVFLTHAHVGHYAGLIHLGREVLGASALPVYSMPRMEQFLRTNGPWSQLVDLQNIQLRTLQADVPVQLNERLAITPVLVPHRDEFSETVAYKISGPRQSVLFLPDIDKWSRWERKIESLIAEVDVAYLDATFFDDSELPGRDMTQIPHPFIVESIERFGSLSAKERAKVKFIHMNHTNPAWDPRSTAAQQILRSGMSLARKGERVGL